MNQPAPLNGVIMPINISRVINNPAFKFCDQDNILVYRIYGYDIEPCEGWIIKHAI